MILIEILFFCLRQERLSLIFMTKKLSRFTIRKWFTNATRSDRKNLKITLTSAFSRSYHRQYTYTQDNLMITSTLMSFDKEPSPQDRHGCNCNKLWLRKAPLESWALSCVKYHLYSWSAFSSTMRKSIIKAPAYFCMMVIWFQVGKIWVEYGPFYYMVEV